MDQYRLSFSDYTVMPMPSINKDIPRVALAGGEVITFNPKMSEEKLKVALEIAESWYLSDEAMQSIVDDNVAGNQVYTHIPARSDWYDKTLDAIPGLSEESKKNMIALRDCARVEPYCEHWSDLKSQLAVPLQKIFLKEGITRNEAAEILNECAETLYELYPDTFRK